MFLRLCFLSRARGREERRHNFSAILEAWSGRNGREMSRLHLGFASSAPPLFLHQFFSQLSSLFYLKSRARGSVFFSSLGSPGLFAFASSLLNIFFVGKPL